MRDPNRIDKVLIEIGKLWHKYPDLRLGQLISNAFVDIYYIEDDLLVERLYEYYDELEKQVQILKEIRH